MSLISSFHFEGAHTLKFSSSQLLHLPRELRRIIYKFCIDTETPIIPYRNNGKVAANRVSHDGTIKTYLVLSRTCRLFYIELVGSSFLYRSTPFSFTSALFMHNFLAAIKPHHRDSLTTIHLPIWLFYRENSLQRLTHSKTVNEAISILPALRYIELSSIDVKSSEINHVGENKGKNVVARNTLEERMERDLRGLEKWKPALLVEHDMALMKVEERPAVGGMKVLRVSIRVMLENREG